MVRLIISSVLLICTIISCDSINPKEGHLKDILPGKWKNSVEGCDTDMYFMVNGNDVILDGTVFTGTFTDNSFEGTCKAGGIKLVLKIELVSEEYIKGYIEITEGESTRRQDINARKLP